MPLPGFCHNPRAPTQQALCITWKLLKNSFRWVQSWKWGPRAAGETQKLRTPVSLSDPCSHSHTVVYIWHHRALACCPWCGHVPASPCARFMAHIAVSFQPVPRGEAALTVCARARAQSPCFLGSLKNSRRVY